jgi:hypothetical protein
MNSSASGVYEINTFLPWNRIQSKLEKTMKKHLTVIAGTLFTLNSHAYSNFLVAGAGNTVIQKKSSQTSRVLYQSPELGIQFEHPRHYKVWQQGRKIFLADIASLREEINKRPANPRIYRALNGRTLSRGDGYLIHITVGQGDFTSANQKHAIFEKDTQGYRVAFGRFNNPPAEKFRTNQWSGYGSNILCSTEDEKTGFHAAGGVCFWGLISNSQRYIMVDTAALTPDQEKERQAIVRSLKFLKATP